MVVSCDKYSLRRCDLFVQMTEGLRFMLTFKSGEPTLSPGATVLIEGSNSPQVYSVLSGMSTRYKTLEDGQSQVTKFLFPRNVKGLQAGLMGEMKHSA